MNYTISWNDRTVGLGTKGWHYKHIYVVTTQAAHLRVGSSHPFFLFEISWAVSKMMFGFTFRNRSSLYLEFQSPSIKIHSKKIKHNNNKSLSHFKNPWWYDRHLRRGVGVKVNQCPKTGDKILMNSNYSTFSYRKEISVLSF